MPQDPGHHPELEELPHYDVKELAQFSELTDEHFASRLRRIQNKEVRATLGKAVLIRLAARLTISSAGIHM